MIIHQYPVLGDIIKFPPITIETPEIYIDIRNINVGNYSIKVAINGKLIPLETFNSGFTKKYITNYIIWEPLEFKYDYQKGKDELSIINTSTVKVHDTDESNKIDLNLRYDCDSTNFNNILKISFEDFYEEFDLKSNIIQILLVKN